MGDIESYTNSHTEGIRSSRCYDAPSESEGVPFSLKRTPPTANGAVKGTGSGSAVGGWTVEAGTEASGAAGGDGDGSGSGDGGGTGGGSGGSDARQGDGREERHGDVAGGTRGADRGSREVTVEVKVEDRFSHVHEFLLSQRGPGSGARVLSQAERFAAMRVTAQDRVVAGKSAIHGLGAFARVPHQPGDMVLEYAGEIVRNSVAGEQSLR